MRTEKGYNYSEDNKLLKDYNNFSDPNRFGLRVGYLILQDIYK